MSIEIVRTANNLSHNLELHTDEAYYLEGVSSKFTEQERKSLIEYCVREEAEICDYSVEDYLYDILGAFSIDDLNIKHFSRFLALQYAAYELDELKTKDISRILEKPLHLVEDPMFCASLLAKRSFHEATYNHTFTQAKEFTKDIKHQASSFELLGFEDVYQELLTYTDGSGKRLLKEAWGNYEWFLESIDINNRHSLYPTDYKLFVPPEKKIILTNPIEQMLLEASTSPNILHRITPREFEKVMKEIFEGFGFDVELTAQSRDGGADLLCMSYNHGIPFKVAVEVKRYAANRPITVDLVRSFVGANENGIKANKLVYVTTSRYTRDALKYCTSPFITNLLELKSLSDIQEWAGEYVKRKSIV